MALALSLLALLPVSAAQASEPPRVVIAVLPNGTAPDELGRVDGLSPGLMSAALSRVGAEQTYLDITQGNRIFDGFYKQRLPFLIPLGTRVQGWRRVARRADSAPAELIPGLLASTLQARGVRLQADRTLITPALLVVNRHGTIDRMKTPCGINRRCPPGVTVVPAFIGQLPRMIARLRGNDMLIALERAPPVKEQQLSLGIAGKGFDGNLVSDSTRLTGLVLSTDVAPTILKRYGVATPSAMIGQPIHTAGGADAERLVSLQDRLHEIVPRRAAVIGTNIFAWLVLTLLVLAVFGPVRGRQAAAVFGLACIYLPGLLIPTAALEPSFAVERLIVALAAPLIGGITYWFVRGYAALAIACAGTVGIYALDLVLGFGLTPLSLMGSNPSLGVRFYGIGNELEATLTAMTVIGTGAALVAWNAARGELSARTQAAWFLGVAAVATVVFAAGRFGADVGAAIVLPVGATTAALHVLGVRGRRFVAIAILAPVLGVAALIGLDLVSGDNSHLTRSVLHASDSRSLSDIAWRRLRSSAGSFARPSNNFFLAIAVVLFVAALAFRQRVTAAFGGREPAVAGVLGAVVATLVGVVANDSGALILVIGAGVLSATAFFVFSQTPPPERDWKRFRRLRVRGSTPTSPG